MITAKAFRDYLKAIAAFSRLGKDDNDHVLILVDETTQHIQPCIRDLSTEDLTVLLLPTNATSWMQPLVVLGFQLIKKRWKTLTKNVFPKTQVDILLNLTYS